MEHLIHRPVFFELNRVWRVYTGGKLFAGMFGDEPVDNFYPEEYFRSADNMYYRYPAEMRIPLYDKRNYNYYAEPKTYHQGFHYMTDIF